MRYQFTHNGKRYSVTGKTQDELMKRVEKKKQELATCAPNKITVRQWIDEWLEVYKKPRVSKNVFSTYRGVLRSVELNMLLQDVKPIHLQAMLNEHQGESYSKLHHISFLLKDCFEQAAENGLIASNPARKLQLPPHTKGTHKPLTDREREIIVSTALESDIGTYPLLMLCCGLRPSEAGMVQGKDYSDGVLHIRGTKTASADRLVPVPIVLRERLERLGESEYAVVNTKGKPTTRETRLALWNRFMKECNIKYGAQTFRPKRSSTVVIVTPVIEVVAYQLRHTYATDLQTMGVPINIAKDLMGHSNISVTSKVYTHLSADAFATASEKVCGFYTFGKNRGE